MGPEPASERKERVLLFLRFCQVLHGWSPVFDAPWELTIQLPDHIHLFVTIPPSQAVADAVKILKGSTARKLFVAFPALKDQLYGGHLWSPSYYVGTVGNVSAETIRHYIERTEHIKGRR